MQAFGCRTNFNEILNFVEIYIFFKNAYNIDHGRGGGITFGHFYFGPLSVWPEWTIFEISLQRCFLKILPKYLATFWAIWKRTLFNETLLWVLCWATFRNFGLLFIPASGNIGHYPESWSTSVNSGKERFQSPR